MWSSSYRLKEKSCISYLKDNKKAILHQLRTKNAQKGIKARNKVELHRDSDAQGRFEQDLIALEVDYHLYCRVAYDKFYISSVNGGKEDVDNNAFTNLSEN